MEECKAVAQSTVQGRQNEIESIEIERNNYKQKAESLAKDVRKLRKMQSKADVEASVQLQQQIDRLQEELSRKNKSLEHAMQALADPEIVEVITPSTSSSPSSTSMDTSPSRTSLPRRKSSRLGSPIMALKDAEEIKHLTERNKTLQHLANELSETVKGKEESVRSLRFANSVLGKRVMELEKEYDVQHDSQCDRHNLEVTNFLDNDNNDGSSAVIDRHRSSSTPNIQSTSFSSRTSISSEKNDHNSSYDNENDDGKSQVLKRIDDDPSDPSMTNLSIEKSGKTTSTSTTTSISPSPSISNNSTRNERHRKGSTNPFDDEPSKPTTTSTAVTTAVSSKNPFGDDEQSTNPFDVPPRLSGGTDMSDDHSLP